MDDAGLFILFEVVIMVTLAIAYGIWCATSDKSDKSEKSEKQKPKVYTYYKKDFDDMWETINSWCVKYCNKEFPRYHDEIFLDKSKMCGVYASYDGNGAYQLEFTNVSHIPTKLYNISWEPTSWVHNYIFYTTRRVD